MENREYVYWKGRLISMTYKEEKQIKLGEQLQKKFDEEKVPDFIQDYFQDIASRQSRTDYWTTIRDTLNWMIEKEYISCESIAKITPELLDQLTKAKIIQYLDKLKSDGLKLTSIQVKKNRLSSFWAHLVRGHYCTDNIIAQIKSKDYSPAKTNRKKAVKTPLQSDIDEMIENISLLRRKSEEFVRNRNLAVIRVLAGTGLREYELVGLDLDDVYLDEKDLDERNPRPYILVISKGNYDYSEEGMDIVYLTNDAVEALREWIDYRSEMENIIDERALFLNSTGNRMKESDVKHLFSKYSNGKITPHMMRHAYTTNLMRETNDPTFVREQGRWKSDAMMNNVYDSGTMRSINALSKL